MMDSSEFDFGRNLTKQLKSELEKAGYSVVDIPVSRKDSKTHIENFKSIDANVDAYLDIVGTFVGYFCEDNFTSRKYKPRIIVHANLVLSENNELIYSELISYGEKDTSDCIHFPIDEKYQYEKFAKLLLDKNNFIEGMNAGISNIGNQIAMDLH